MQPFLSIAYSVESITNALSWALLHSLWQGVLAALFAGVIILLTKKTKPVLRYNLLAATLLVFLAGVAYTFIAQLLPANEIPGVTITDATAINVANPSTEKVIANAEFSVTDNVVAFFDTYARWIVLTWLLIIGYKFIRLSAGLYGIYQLKIRSVYSPGEYWNKRMIDLCKQIQVNKQVQLLQSGIVQIPAVIGFFKPVILFPAAMLNGMPVQEVEAVLIHELGHIRRKDFLVNMLQNVVEIIFFFNPAVLWVSLLLKTERENCCDDIAVALTANKQDYIKALISFQQFNQPKGQQLALAFSGEKKHLLNRVKRIVYNNNKTLNNMEKNFLSAGLVLATACLCAFISIKAQSIQKSNPSGFSNKEDKTNSSRRINDTIPIYKIGRNTNMTGTTHTIFEGKEYNIKIKNSTVTELIIDGNKIPAEKIIDYKAILDRIHSGMIAHSEKAMKDSEQAMTDSEQAMKDSEQAMKDSEQAMKDMERIIYELIAAKIIKHKSELKSLSLNVTELMVNGVKQPSAIHKKLKDKYVKSETVTLWYETD
ncbi:MAG: M56 family metallopeptidase [Ferruginibacter sp.]